MDQILGEEHIQGPVQGHEHFLFKTWQLQQIDCAPNHQAMKPEMFRPRLFATSVRFPMGARSPNVE